MQLPRVRFTVRRMLVLVVFVALVAALVAQQRNADQRLAKLKAELNYIRTLVPDPYSVASGHNFNAKIEAAGDRLLIVTAAELMDRRLDPAYVWLVRISDPSGKHVVFSKRYDNRVVRPPRGQNFNTAFIEILRPPLPPGDYRVKVSLLGIPPDAGLSGLDDVKNYDGYEVVSSNGKVTLAPKE
jgi:hypothetical protein